MELRPLTLDELHSLYLPSLSRDFPPDELMPWEWMEPLARSGRQESLGLFDGENLAAYAILIAEESNAPAALLNYFAVEPGCRDQGIGSLCLKLLRESLAGTDRAIIFEVESPEAASSPEESALRRRRIEFYQRGGAIPTGVDSQLFGVDYHIMLLTGPDRAQAPADVWTAAALERLYHIVVPQGPEVEFTFDQVCRVFMSESREQGQFSRELGRALTCLIRSRKKFMGEKLREHGFSGAMYLILLHVDRHPGASQDSIATHMYLDKCTVARRTKKLEELGCLYRETDPSDRRQNQLYLTEKGQALAPEIRGYLGQWGEGVAAGMTEEERSTLLALLTKMTGQDKR